MLIGGRSLRGIVVGVGYEGAGSRLRTDGPPEQLMHSVKWEGDVMAGQSILHHLLGPGPGIQGTGQG